MSIKSAKSFIERMDTDAEFTKLAMEQKGKEKMAAFLKAAGYEFSKEEYNDALKSVHGTELSDDSLDNVAGGSMGFRRVVNRNLFF